MTRLLTWCVCGLLFLQAGVGMTCEMAADPAREMPDIAYQRGLDCALSAKSREDVDAALAWYQSAAERGQPRAMYNLGLIHENRAQPEQAQAWFRKAAELGHPGAQFKYGYWLMSSEPQAAIPWLRKAAEAGHQRAQMLLGDLSMQHQDYIEAYKWYQAAWMSGNLPAYAKQQMAYQHLDPASRVLAMDIALDWMEAFANRAASGERMTCSESCLAGGVDRQPVSWRAEVLPADERMWRAARLYCAGGRLGNPEPLYRLGMLYWVGAGVPVNREAAAALFRKAQAQGHREAEMMLGMLGAMPEGVLPACVVGNVDPERKPPVLAASGSQVADPVFKGREWIVEIVESIARSKNVDPRLVLAVIRAESGFNPKAVSHKNAMGLMQLIPDTARRFNVRDVFDVVENVTGGVTYLRWLLDRYQGDLYKVVAAYNAGEGHVDRYKGVPPFRETQEYVDRVMRYLGVAGRGNGRTRP